MNLSGIYFILDFENNVVFMHGNMQKKLYYVFIISDRFLVRFITIYHILQSNGNKNVVASIRHVSCFHLERYNKMIKIVYYVIHVNFPIKSIDSCWMLMRGQHETYPKWY